MLGQSHNLRASPARLQPCSSTTHSLPARVRPRRAVRHSASAAAVPGAGSLDDSARGSSINYPYPPEQRQQQQYLQQPGQQLLRSKSGEETDILWAGYR